MASDPVDLPELRRLVEAVAPGTPWVPLKPAVVLALLDRIDALEAEVTGLDEAYETVVATNRRLEGAGPGTVGRL